MKRLGMPLLAIGLVSVIVVMMENRFVRAMIYPAPAIAVSLPPSGFQQVHLVGENRIKIEGWLQDRTGNSVLLYFHGNGENLETMRQSGLLEELQAFKIPFLTIDYPGYGNSSGEPSEEAILDASKESIRYLSERYPNKKLVVCGWSLGAAVALRSAAENPKQVHAVIAMSGWSSLPEVGALHFPKYFVSWLLRERYDSMDACRKLRCPALFIHGENDDLIPVSHGEKLSWATRSKVQWIKVPNTGHNDLLSRRIVWTEIAKFLKESDPHSLH